MAEPLYLVIAIDVEEEGLFSGRYPRQAQGVANVAELRRLEFISRDLGFPLTLLVTYPVLQDPEARRLLSFWQKTWGAEIGVHLHPWNTPPFSDDPRRETDGPGRVPLARLAAKLETLAGAVTKHFQEPPRSFRMGRFEWSWELLQLLPRLGLQVDSSMVPLAFRGPGRDNFLAPLDPFWVQNPTTTAASPLLEVPVTMVPVFPRLARITAGVAGGLPAGAGKALLGSFRYLGAVGIHPAWFPAFSLRLAALLHRRRGGRVLNLFLHSTELYPGGNPRFPDPPSVAKLVGKLRRFLLWLQNQGPLRGVTLSQLYSLWPRPGP